jgi:hypothetical protein
MSAFLAVNYGDRIELLTDGAVYTEDGTLIATREKVVRITSIRCAITARGAIEPLDAIGLYLEIVGAITGSFDATMMQLESLVTKMKDQGGPAFEMVICGISETDGPVIAYFCTAKAYPQLEPFTLYRIYDAELCGGAALDTATELPAAGITAESVKDGLAAKGADIMELMRRKPGPNPIRPDLPPVYGIGGHVDLTVIRTDGLATTRLRIWPDVVGARINPHSQEALEEMAA